MKRIVTTSTCTCTCVSTLTACTHMYKYNVTHCYAAYKLSTCTCTWFKPVVNTPLTECSSQWHWSWSESTEWGSLVCLSAPLSTWTPSDSPQPSLLIDGHTNSAWRRNKEINTWLEFKVVVYLTLIIYVEMYESVPCPTIKSPKCIIIGF